MSSLEPRPNYGITRIDQTEKKNHGFYVRITHRGKTFHKYFPDKASGGRGKALQRARKHRDEILQKMPKNKREAAARKPRKILRSGTSGVTHVVSRSPKGIIYEYWQAAWIGKDGKRRTAKYSISRYGNERALKLAKRAKSTASRVKPPRVSKRAGRKEKE